MIKGVFFDAGNTLVLFDCEYLSEIMKGFDCSVPCAVIREAEHKARFAVDREFLSLMESKGGLPSGTASMHSTAVWRTYFSILLNSIGAAEEKHPEIIETLLRREKANAKGLWHRLEPEVQPVLSELRARGYFLGVMSNSDGRLRNKFDDLQLTQYFDFILDSEEVGVEKPDMRFFDIGLRRCGLAAGNALYVGDLYTVDVLAARQAGMQAVLYDPGELYQRYEANRIRQWRELLPMLPDKTAKEQRSGAVQTRS